MGTTVEVVDSAAVPVGSVWSDSPIDVDVPLFSEIWVGSVEAVTICSLSPWLPNGSTTSQAKPKLNKTINVKKTCFRIEVTGLQPGHSSSPQTSQIS